MRKRRAVCVLLLALTVLATGRVSVASADDPPLGLEMEAEAAFGGYFKYGEWLPVWVWLENNGPDVEAEVQIRITGGWGATTFAAPALLPTGSRKRIPVYVLPNNFSHELEVRLVRGDDVLLSQKTAVTPRANSSYFVGLVSPERGALALILGASVSQRDRPKELIDLSLADVPERAEAWRSFDCLILNDVDTTSLTPEQIAALEAWVRQGGRLVIGGGAGAMRTVAGLPHSLLPFVPRDLAEVNTLPGLAGFASEEVRTPGPFVVAIGEPGTGRTLATQDDLSLVRERCVGNGYVDFVALDLATSPFDGWTGTTDFWEKLLSPGATYPDWLPADMSPRQMRSGQMTYALSNLPSLDLPSIRGLGVLLVLYVVLVGPVNYLALRWRKRLHWGWVTIPLITVAFSAGAFGLGYTMRGSDLILNKIAVIDLLPDGTASVTSYVGLFSPARQAYEIKVDSDGLLAPLNPDYNPWGPGGTSATSDMVFLQGDPGRVRGLAVNQWSMQTFMAEGGWAGMGRIASDLWVKDGALIGTVRNETAHALTGVTLILGNEFVRLGDLGPGKEVPVTMNLTDPTGQSFGPPISYRLFEEEFNRVGPGGPPRDVQLKQTVVDAVFEQGGWFGRGPLRYGGGSSLELLLLGWLDEAPPDVRVAGRKPAQQTTALLYAALPYRLSEEGGVISLPPGFIPGTLIELPAEGGTCGPLVTSVYIVRGQATFEFQLPPEVQDVRLEALKLLIGTDGGWGWLPDTAVYNWNAGTWTELEDPVIGVNVLSEPGSLVSEDGLVHVRLSSQGDGGSCLYLELGLEGRR